MTNLACLVLSFPLGGALLQPYLHKNNFNEKLMRICKRPPVIHELELTVWWNERDSAIVFEARQPQVARECAVLQQGQQSSFG